MLRHGFWMLMLLSCSWLQAAVPQGKDDEVQKLGPLDPYTAGDAAVMAQAGIVGYGPMPWADGLTTTDVDRVLGERRVLWLETAHFRIGSNLRSWPLPTQQEQKKFALDELKRLKRVLPKVPERPRKLDPWLRLHLYAMRAEAAYADFQERLQIKDGDFPGGDQPRQGKYLGLPDKFLLLLFQPKSDLARYLDRFCGVKAEKSYRFYTTKSHQMLAAVSAEGIAAPDDLALYSHVVYCLVHNFVSGYQGFYYDLPAWLPEGLAQCYARRVPTQFINVMIDGDDVVDEERQHLWPQKVRARVGFDDFAKADTVLRWQQAGLDYLAFVMSWSRVDYLLTLGDDKLALLLRRLKTMPLPQDGTLVTPQQLDAVQRQLLQQLYGFDAEGFDRAWKEWVLKTYPRK